MPTDAQLKTELATDPSALGYHKGDQSFKSAKEITGLLGQRLMIANPDTQGVVPKPMNTDALLALVSTGSIADIPADAIEAVSIGIDQGQRSAVKRWFGIAYAKSWISPAEYTALLAELNATVADPDYASQVPGSTRLETLWSESGITAEQVERVIADIEGGV